MGVFNLSMIPVLDEDPHSASSNSSKSCHNMMEKGLKSSHLQKEINKRKERIIKSKATSSAAASVKFCVCAPATHPDSFKCRLHRATSSSYMRTVSSSAPKKPCLCAPATHPGSFKCRLHRATTSSHTKSVSSSAHHISGVKYTKNLNPLKPVALSQSGGIRNSSKGNVHGKPKLSRFGRAALAHAAAAETSNVQRECSWGNSSKGNVHGKPKLSRFGRAALAHAAAAETSNVQIQPISAALRQMSLG